MRFGPRSTFGFLCGVYIAAGMSLSGIGPALERISANSGMSLTALGSLFTAIALGGVLAQFGAGPLGERSGLRPVIMVGCLMMGVGMLGISGSRVPFLLLFCALLAGTGFGCLLAGANVLTVQLFPNRSISALSILNLCFGVGSILGPAIAGVATLQLNRAEAVLWLGGGLLLLQLIFVARYAEGTLTRLRSSLRAAAGVPALWILGLLLLIYTGSEIAMSGWITEIIRRSAGIGAAEAAFAASIFWAALTAGRGVGALLGLRLSPQSMLQICVIGMLIGAGALTASSGSFVLIMISLIILGLSYGPIFPSAMALTAQFGNGSASATSLVLAIGNLGGLGIPALLGWLVIERGPQAGSSLLLVNTIIILGLLLILHFIQRTPLAHSTTID